MRQYLDVVPQKGKWYISEGYEATRGPREVDPPNRSAALMLVAGPFDTREQAEADLLNHGGVRNPYIWQVSGGETA